MKSYIDIHSHILPGLDDGSEDFEMSLRMLRQAAEDGIGEMILTPHYKPMRRNVSPEKIRKVFRALEEKKNEAEIPIRLHLGSEIYYSSEALPALREGAALTMAGTSYVLIEFSPREDYAYIRDAAYSLLSEGYSPILAHVERYGSLMAKKVRVEELYDMGCCIQVNAASVTGENGWESRQDVKWLLRREYVHFVGTDSHDDRKRTPKLGEAASYVAKKYGEAYCGKLFGKNADVLLKAGYL
ncbi:MAG: hypothetical protein NC392_06225 [Roseburia sp.]|nr:hypothetical protein [Roseburia sp.]MCM1202052.1 hypothetical protein [Bacteroides fragilis]